MAEAGPDVAELDGPALAARRPTGEEGELRVEPARGDGPRPHVLHVTKRMPPALGGDAVVVAHLRRAQEDQGWRTSVLTSRCDDIADADGLHRTGLPLAQEQIDSIGPWRVLSLLVTALSAFVLLRRLRPDVVHAHTVDLGVALAPACAVYGVPRVITLHGTSIGNPWFPAFKRNLELLLLRAGGYARVFTVDPTTVPALRERGVSGVSAVLNAVPVAELAARADDVRGSSLLFVGRLEDVKGVDVLLDALALVTAQGVETRLDVVGDGSKRSALEEQAARLGIADRVRFLGARPADDVGRRMRAAGALVLPSRFEGLALVLLEAWASGLPVVTTDAGAVPAICRDGRDSLVVPVGDTRALAAAISAAVTDPRAARERARTARATVEREHSYPALSRHLTGAYREVAEESGGGLVANAVAQVLATAAMAAGGALFWFLAARLYPSADVGRATALISASSVVSLISLAGFHTTLLRFLATSRRRSAYLDTSLVVSGVAGLVLASAYLLLVPVIAPDLAGVRSHWASALAFVLVTCATSVNTMTDSAFLSLRAARYNLYLDGGLQTVSRLVAIVVMSSGGYLGVFLGSGAGTVAAAVVSVAVLVRRFGYQPKGRLDTRVVRQVRGYAAGNHLAYVLNLLPTLAIPSLALNWLGAASAAHLYLAFTVANVLFGAAYAITSATFAETSYGERSMRSVLGRSGAVLAAVVLPSGVVLALLGGQLLGLFGADYAEGATTALLVFAASAPLVAAYDLATVVLRAQQRTTAHVVVQAAYCASFGAVAAAWHSSTTEFALAWLIATAAGLAVAAVLLITRRAAPSALRPTDAPQKTTEEVR